MPKSNFRKNLDVAAAVAMPATVPITMGQQNCFRTAAIT